MTSQLGECSAFGSLWTAKSNYIVDFERGLVTHSKTLTKGQFNRYMKRSYQAIQRPDLNPRQAFYYFSTYISGQKYLQFIRQQHQNEIYKLYFQSSWSYVANHKQQYQKIQNQLAFPIAQIPYGGYVRTDIERDNLVKYVNNNRQKASMYGMKSWQKFQKQASSQRTYKQLRDIAFKQRQKKEITPEQNQIQN